MFQALTDKIHEFEYKGEKFYIWNKDLEEELRGKK